MDRPLHPAPCGLCPMAYSGLPHGAVFKERASWLKNIESPRGRWSLRANTEMESGTPSPQRAEDLQQSLPDTQGPRTETQRPVELGSGPYSHSPPPSCPVPWPQKQSWPVPRGCWDGIHPHRSRAPVGTSLSPERPRWRASSPCCADPVGDRTGEVGGDLPAGRPFPRWQGQSLSCPLLCSTTSSNMLGTSASPPSRWGSSTIGSHSGDEDPSQSESWSPSSSRKPALPCRPLEGACLCDRCSCCVTQGLHLGLPGDHGENRSQQGSGTLGVGSVLYILQKSTQVPHASPHAGTIIPHTVAGVKHRQRQDPNPAARALSLRPGAAANTHGPCPTSALSSSSQGLLLLLGITNSALSAPGGLFQGPFPSPLVS